MTRGQASTEYLLLIAVLAVGLAVAAYAFLPAFTEGGDDLADDASRMWSAGTQDGQGGKR